MVFSNRVYDVLKWLSCVVLNAIGILYSKLAQTWGLPFGDKIMTTCAALALFIGALIGISTAEYNAGKRLQIKETKKE